MTEKPVLTVDIGGTKVAAALVTRQGVILDKTRQPTQLTGPQAVVEQVMARPRSSTEFSRLQAWESAFPRC